MMVDNPGLRPGLTKAGPLGRKQYGMLSGIHIFCFFATCALVVLGMEVSRLFFRMPVRLVLMLGVAAAGFVAQTLYLAHRAWTGELPLSSWHDWFLVAAWILVAAYLLSLIHI